MILGRSLKAPRRLRSALRWTAYFWMGAFAVLLSVLAASDLVGLAWRLAIGGPVTLAGHPFGQLQAWAAAGVVAPALAFGFARATGSPKLERLRVEIPGLGAGLDGLRVVQLSDLHIGETLGREWLEGVVAQVQALRPDLVAITGDLVDGSAKALREEVAPLCALSAPLGVYYVTGNHETYHGAAAWEALLSRMGLTVLHNEHRVVERGGARLTVAGVTDFSGGSIDRGLETRPDLAFQGAPEGVPRVLLAHQPRSAFAAAQHGVALQLSGHTHAGQIFPWMFFVRLQQPTIQGLKAVAGVPVYTSRGTGYWGPPIRLGAPPEITELTLTAGRG
jgi:predicted MPP superfamily phosphohydrolase